MGAKEEEELKRLKEKQAKRKEIRIEQEKKLAAEKKAEEEQKRREEAARKEALEEAEIRRQEMMEAQKEGGKKSRNSGPTLDLLVRCQRQRNSWRKRRTFPSESVSNLLTS